MPNIKGGKNYKKMKHTQGVKPELHEIGEGQMIGKILRMLGDRQASVYCNDNIERICRIRGKLHKRVWMGTDDIVLISLRTFATFDSDDSDLDSPNSPSSPHINPAKGDILAKYDSEMYGRLKKIDGVNKKLFGGANSKGGEDDYFDADSDEEVKEKVMNAEVKEKVNNEEEENINVDRI